MPKVPGYEPGQVGISTQGGPGFIGAKASPEDFGAGAGEAVQRFGSFILKAQEEAFQLRRDSINNELRTAAQDRLSRIQTIKGQAAADPALRKGKSLSDEGDEELRATFDKLMGDKRLSAQQREVLENDFRTHQAALRARTDAHTQQELNTWKEGEHQRKITGIVQDVQQLVATGLTPVTQGLLPFYEAQLVAAAEQEAQRTGADVPTAKLKAQSLVGRVAVEALFDQGKFTEAKAMFDALAKEKKFDPKDYDALKKAVDKGAAVTSGNAAGVELYDRVSKGELTLTQALKETSKLDPVAAEQAAGMLSRLNTAAKQDKIVAVSNAVGGLDSMRLEGRPTHAIKSSPMFITFASEHPSEAREYLKGLEVEDRIRRQEYEQGDKTRIDDSLAEVDSLLKLKNLMFEGDLRNKSENDIRSLAAGLLPKHRDDLVKVWAEVKGKPGWAPPLQAVQSTLLNLGFNDRKGGLTPEGKALALKLIPQIRDITERSGSSVGMDQETLTKTITRLTTQFTLDKNWAKDPTIMGGELSKVLDDQENFKLFYRQKISDNFKDKIIAKWNQDPRFNGSVEATLGIHETQREIAKHWIRLYELGRIDPATGDLMAKE